MPWTEWLINNRTLFLTVLEVGKSKNKALADSVTGSGFIDNHLSLCPDMAEEERVLSEALPL